MLSWFYLLIAGLFEMGWPLGFKLSSLAEGRAVWLWIAVSVVSMAASGFFLYLAQKVIPIGTSYIVWTGIGGVGTVIVGILFFGDGASVLRLFFLSLILIGIVGLKLVH